MKENKLVPKLRFPKFLGNWNFKKIKSITKIKAGGTPSTVKSDYWNGEILWMNSGELNLKRIFDVENRITENGLKNSSTHLIPKECILIGLAGQGKTRGTAAINYVELCTNQSIASIYPNKSIFNSEFLYQNINSRYDELRNLSTGAGGRGGLNLQIIGSFKVPVPSLPEQQKIASFLSDVDAKITKLTKKKTLLEQYKKGLMQKIFNQELRFKDDNGNDFPKWEVKKLRDLGNILNGLTGKTKEDFGEGKPYIQYKQIFDSSKININKCGFVEITSSDNQTKMQYGDVFFTTSSETPNEIGTASVLLDEVDEMYLNSFCFGFRVKQTLLYPSFSQFLFRSNGFRKKMIPLAQGSTRYNISKSSFLKLKVQLPSIEEQTKIANFLSEIDIKIEVLNTKIENSKTFKKGLLQQMFV
jgi:type I restriction enzyme S subunit